jgi:hypothetical protein
MANERTHGTATARANLIRWSLAAVALLTACGCARPRAFLPPFRRAPAPTVESLLAPLRQRAAPISTLWLRAGVAIRQSGRPGKAIFNATILAQPPDRVRLRAYRNVTILVFDLLADARELRLHDTVEDRYYAADYSRLRQSNSLWAGFSPSLLIQALAVEQTVLDRAASARSATVFRRWRTLELRLDTAEDRMRVALDSAGRQIVGLAYERAAGGKPVQVRYGEMVEAGGVRLPRWIEVEIAATGTRMRLDVSEYKVNQPFDAKVFRLEAPPGRPWLPLENLK